MSKTMKLTILTPEKEFYKGEIVELITETIEGKVGILSNHLPLIAALNPTVTEIVEADGERKKVFTSSGILSVLKKEILLLCDEVGTSEQYDSNN